MYIVCNDVCILCVMMCVYCVVMKETNGDGVGRIVDASGVASVVNSCFTMLRYQLLTLCNCCNDSY